MPTIAVSTYSFGPECSAHEGMDFAVKHGFRALELGSWTLWPEKLLEEDVRMLRSRAAWEGVEFSIHFIHRGVAPASHVAGRRAQHLVQLESTLNLAYDLGARAIVVHPGPIDCQDVGAAEAPEPVRHEARKHLAEFLSKAAEVAGVTGTVLCVENLAHSPGQTIQSYAELVDLIDTVGHPAVRVSLDTGHADLSDGLRPAFEAFAPHLRHMHIHDSNGQRDHHEVGKANVDFAAHRDLLESYPFTMAIESRDESDPEGCVLRSRDRLKGLLGAAAR